LWLALLLAAIAASATAIQAARSALRAPFGNLADRGFWGRTKLRGITAALHVLQPAARLWGRRSYGLTPWRRQIPRSSRSFAWPRARTSKVWSETWQSADERLRALEALLREQRIAVRRGGAYNDWDLEVRGGFFACVRIRLALEEFPGGRQFVCFRSWPCLIKPSCAVGALPLMLALGAGLQGGHVVAAIVLGALACMVIARAMGDCGVATRSFLNALARYDEQVRGIALADALLRSPTPSQADPPVAAAVAPVVAPSYLHDEDQDDAHDDALNLSVGEVL
jgi:hypothetical protein